jgi:hypothetical protein
MPKSMTFAAGSGSVFQSVPEDPTVQTFVAKNAVPGQALEFTVSGSGSIPREAQGGAQQGDNGGQAAGTPGNQPGGGIGQPINTPDPLSKYKWWILCGLALLLAAGAGFLLRKPVAAPATSAAFAAPDVTVTPVPAFSSPAAKNAALLGVLKDELFALESERISGTISPEEYAQVKAALETVLKRALGQK